LVNFKIIKHKEMGNMYGMMVEFMKVNGNKIKWMGKGYFIGQKEINILDNI